MYEDLLKPAVKHVSQIIGFSSIDPVLSAALRKRASGIFLEVKGRPTRKAHNLTAICEPTV
jgi:hypothetical protein